MSEDTFDLLKVVAETYHDAQKLRVATEHRMRHMNAAPVALTEHIDALITTEKRLARGMKKAFKDAAPEIYTWTMATPGLGEHSMARLIGAIGDPIHAEPWRWMAEAPEEHSCGPRCGKDRHLVAGEPFDRTARQLLAYCGHGDPAAKRRKGMNQDETLALGNPVAKMLLHEMAVSCIKQMGSGAPIRETAASLHTATDPATVELQDAATASRESADGGDPSTDDGSDKGTTATARPVRRRSPYRDAYDQARAKYADREEWTDAHKHNAALRYTAKQIGVDLWRVASGLPPRWKSEDGL